MKLVDGLGRLGKELSKYLNNDIDWTIYHTWNIDDKSEKAQALEYEKFCAYVDNHLDEKICFISTSYRAMDSYMIYKRKAEKYIRACADFKIVICPALVGKGGLYERCAKGLMPEEGSVQISTISRCAEEIIKFLKADWRILEASYELVDVRTIYELIQYGVKFK
jgi:hypothetical protein